MEARSLYGPCLDICTSSTGKKLPLSLLASILTDSKEFQVLLKAGVAYGLRLVTAAQPRLRLQRSLKGVTSLVTGGTKVGNQTRLMRDCSDESVAMDYMPSLLRLLLYP